MPFALPPGRESVVRELLGAAQVVGWHLHRATIRGGGVEAELRDEEGRRRTVFLSHPASGTPTDSLQTEHVVIWGPGMGAGDPLLQAIADRARRDGTRLGWLEVGEPPPAGPADVELVDPEWEAVRAGLKPGVRVCSTPARLEAVARRLRAAGAEVIQGALGGAGGLGVVYAAPTSAVARRLCDAEATGLRRVGGPLPGDHRALGRALGYPECCVDAYAALTGRDEVFGEHSTSEIWLAARSAWVARPRRRLNNLLARELTVLVTFAPCRYDCPSALAFADALAAHLARLAPRWLDRTERLLACRIVVDRAGSRAVLGLAPEHLIASATPPAEYVGGHAPPDVEAAPADTALAERLPGRRLAARGAGGTEPGGELFIDFSWDQISPLVLDEP